MYRLWCWYIFRTQRSDIEDQLLEVDKSLAKVKGKGKKNYEAQFERHKEQLIEAKKSAMLEMKAKAKVVREAAAAQEDAAAEAVAEECPAVEEAPATVNAPPVDIQALFVAPRNGTVAMEVVRDTVPHVEPDEAGNQVEETQEDSMSPGHVAELVVQTVNSAATEEELMQGKGGVGAGDSVEASEGGEEYSEDGIGLIFPEGKTKKAAASGTSRASKALPREEKEEFMEMKIGVGELTRGRNVHVPDTDLSGKAKGRCLETATEFTTFLRQTRHFEDLQMEVNYYVKVSKCKTSEILKAKLPESSKTPVSDYVVCYFPCQVEMKKYFLSLAIVYQVSC